MSQLNGRVAIVTEGVQGIGLGVSLSLARAGADVVLAEAVEGRIPAAVAEIEALDAQALGVHTDVTKASSVDHMVRATLERFGQIDILVNGENVVGWKVGGELVGRVFERVLYSSPASLPVERFRDTLVEVELGFRLLANLPARSESYGVDEVVEAAALVPTFEFVASRFAGEWPNPEVESEWLLMAADNAVVAGVVVVAELSDWKGVKLLEIPISASIDGGAPLPIVPPERRRDPVDVLVWLVNHLSGRGIGLAAGQIATLGAAIAGVPMGRSVTAEFGDWGRIEATVAGA